MEKKDNENSQFFLTTPWRREHIAENAAGNPVAWTPRRASPLHTPHHVSLVTELGERQAVRQNWEASVATEAQEHMEFML